MKAARADFFYPSQPEAAARRALAITTIIITGIKSIPA